MKRENEEEGSSCPAIDGALGKVRNTGVRISWGMGEIRNSDRKALCWSGTRWDTEEPWQIVFFGFHFLGDLVSSGENSNPHISCMERRNCILYISPLLCHLEKLYFYQCQVYVIVT